jgi:hypothetical protein
MRRWEEEDDDDDNDDEDYTVGLMMMMLSQQAFHFVSTPTLVQVRDDGAEHERIDEEVDDDRVLGQIGVAPELPLLLLEDGQHRLHTPTHTPPALTIAQNPTPKV